MKKKNRHNEWPDEKLLDERPEKVRENPFDLDTHTPLQIVYECGRHGLPKQHAIRLLRNNVSETTLRELVIGLQTEGSEYMEQYEDGVAIGEAEMSSALRQATINSEKDSYKSMSAEERRKSINAMIEKNFGIGQ